MKLSQVQDIEFALLDWPDLDRLTRELADVVNQNGTTYDRIIPLANGGLTMVRHFADLINLRKISTMQVAFYRGIGVVHSRPEIVQALPVPVEGESLLIFEDIVDTGATLEFALEHLTAMGAKQVHTASLFRKSHASVHPEYSAQLLDRWVIFPYETRESISDLSQKWAKADLSESQIIESLGEIGFSADDIGLFRQRP